MVPHLLQRRGHQEETAAFELTRNDGTVGYLATRCDNPAALDPPVEDKGPTVEAGTIVFKRLGADDDGSLVTMSSDGSTSGTIRPPDGWDGVGMPSIGPDGRTITALLYRNGDRPGAGIAQGTLRDGLHAIYETTDYLSCPRQSADETVLVTANDSERLAAPAELLVISEGAATVVDLPVADFFCGVQLESGEYVLDEAQTDRTKPGVLARVDPTTGELSQIADGPGCTTLSSDLSARSGRLLLAQTCANVRQTGAYALDPLTGSIDQILQRSAATPTWSPTGEWIAVALAGDDNDRRDDVTIWLLRPDGSGLRRLTDTPSSFPVWTSDEL